MRTVLTPEQCAERLNVIFPRAAFDSVMSGPLAGAAVATLLYVDAIAIGPVDFWARPSMVMWMSPETLSHDSSEKRREWRTAAERGRKALEAVLESWRVPPAAGYADNSRETLRDETFRLWREAGAIRERPGVPKNSSKGRWALEPHFAALFDADLEQSAFEEAAHHWQDQHFELNSSLPGFRRAGREVRAMVKFGVFNLLQPLTSAGQFDVIFCRNVMIYFEQSTRDHLVSRLVGQLLPGGYLFTGHSETLLRLPPGLSYVQPAIYKRV